MLVLKKTRKKIRLFKLLNIFLPLFVTAVLFNACGGGSGAGNGNEDSEKETQEDKWTQSAIGNSLGSGGLLSPRVSAAMGSDGNIHIAYFDDSDTNATDYVLNYIVTDISTLGGSAETVISVDNTSALSLSLGPDNSPVVAYQGGEVRECNNEKRSDAMFSVRQSGGWNEYTGAIGVVARNPTLPDGLAGKELSVVVDSAGFIHIAYQFFYEGCDEQNFTYPDIMYVKKDPNALATPVAEEVVEGNTYINNSLGIQNSAGTYASITLDSQGDPAIFYYATLSDGTTGLRVARKKNNVWTPEWIETDCEIGDISAARSGEDYLAVAYYVKSCKNKDDANLLRYAKEQSSAWVLQTVDDSVKAGNYCSLAFSSSGKPAIAYYALESYSGRDLKDLYIAQLNENSWDLEVVASTGDIGLYNNLLFDGESPIIISYSGTDRTIYAFY